jgi:hypothetical protein
VDKKAIIALSNAVTDIVIDISEEDLTRLGLKKGYVNYPPKISLEGLKHKKSVPGGSPANVVVGVSLEKN